MKNASVLEIGCADGVLIKSLLERWPNVFGSLIGVDISPMMIEEAIRTTKDSRVKYFLRGVEPGEKNDLVIELGVHSQNFDAEINSVSEKLKESGYFIYCVAGRSSLHARFKLLGVSYVNDYMSYAEYEKIIKKYFDVLSSEPYGLFIPKLWAFPRFAMVVQPILEKLFRNMFSNLFHEKIYLLRKKQ